MKIADAVIILFLLLGAVMGFKKGFIKTFVSFVGVLLTIIISLYLKQPIVNIIYAHFPFFSFGGLSVMNIFLYESIAFLLIYVLLSCILGVIVNVTGVIEKLLNMTIILGLVSKILGAVAGLLEMLLFTFIACFVLLRFSFSSSYINDSKVAMTILGKTPIVANIAAPTYNSLVKIYDLQKQYAKDKNKINYNYQALGILVQNGVISKEQAEQFIKDGKIDVGTTDGMIMQLY